MSERLEHIFDELETTDFELVMRRLNQALSLMPHYDVPGDATGRNLNGFVDRCEVVERVLCPRGESKRLFREAI